jgi:hypothetical protein
MHTGRMVGNPYLTGLWKGCPLIRARTVYHLAFSGLYTAMRPDLVGALHIASARCYKSLSRLFLSTSDQ